MNGRERRGGRVGGMPLVQARAAGSIAPGKRTLTMGLQKRADQQAGGDADPARVQARAAEGVIGPGAPLPHRDLIARSFGAHDVSHVNAHVGGEAAAAAGDIGAVAYTTGADVAFATPPDLHTAAHEAAHVVQQQHGVQLKGGIGQPGDEHERHADAVADAVVARRSAEPLLAAMPASGSAGGGVQRKEDLTLGGFMKQAMSGDPRIGGSPPETEPTHEERAKRDRFEAEHEWAPTIISAMITARKALAATALPQPAAAKAAGLAGCEALADHLGMIEFGKDRDPLLKVKVTDLTAVVYQLVSRIQALGAGDAAQVEAMTSALAQVQSQVPDEMVPTFDNVEDAAEASKAGTAFTDNADPVRLIARHLIAARSRFNDGVEAFRQQLFGQRESEGEAGSKKQKLAHFSAIVADATPWLEYVTRTLERGDLGAHVEGPQLTREAERFHEAAQRFVYWAMNDAAVPKPAQALAAVVDPLCARFNLPALAVESGAPETEQQRGALDGTLKMYRDNWKLVYDAQRGALDSLIAAEPPQNERDKKSSSWSSVLVGALGAARFNWVIGLIAGGASTYFGDKTGGPSTDASRSAAKSGASDVIKGLARSVFDTQAAKRPASGDDTRTTFFVRQKLALIDLEHRHLTEFTQRDEQEARQSPTARAALLAEASAAGSTAVKVADEYTLRAVQDWATHLAAAVHGVDERTGGVDLDGVGGFTTGELEPLDRPRPAGVLEIVVEIGKPGEPLVVKKATAGGLRSDDAARLSGQRIGDLDLPVQVRAYSEYAEAPTKNGGVSAPPSFLISRNREGTVWLSETTPSSSEWLRDHADASAVRGAQLLFEELANHYLPDVSGS